VLLVTFSGACFGVPAAVGHGNGKALGPHFRGGGPPRGRGPDGAGPPGQIRKAAKGNFPPGLAHHVPVLTPGPALSASGGGQAHRHGHGVGHGNGAAHGNAKLHGNARARKASRGRAAGAAAGPPGHARATSPAHARTAAPSPPAAVPAAGPRPRLARGPGSGNSTIVTSSAPTRAAGDVATVLTTRTARSGPLGSTLAASGAAGAAGAVSGASGAITGALAPGTAAIGTAQSAETSARAQGAGHASGAGARGSHTRRGASVVNDPAATVIERVINVIPTGVWIALAVSLALAAVAGVAALRSNRRLHRQAGEVAAVTAAALTDPLTGVLNRRGFLESAERELGRARRYGHPLAVAFVDIRGLKAVNDSEGHLAGDRLLRRVTMLLRESARTHDLVGRIGGDELAVLLAEQSADGAAAMTQRVRSQVPAHRASLHLATPWDVTIGTAAYPEDGTTFEELLEAADRRLYEQRGIRIS
jgi:diguanylate cyclase (GGDEF)-like protein